MFNQSEYIKSVEFNSQRPSDLPQVLLLGRSNVGKSSFINGLCNRKNLARISSTPGKTVLLNFYLVDEMFYIVDAPGYGYARRSKVMQQKFVEMIDGFLHESEQLKMVCLLVDFKVGPTVEDIEMYEYLMSMGLPVLVIATKLDKIPSTKRYKQDKKIKELLGNPRQYIKVSSLKKINLNLVQQFMYEHIKDKE